jgi:hypothetical protein
LDIRNHYYDIAPCEQTPVQRPQPVHFELLIDALLLLIDMAPDPHADTHFPQPLHEEELTL